MDNQNKEGNEDKTEFTVQIFDLSNETDDKVVELLKDFSSKEHAVVFANAYVRDSVERCRIPGGTNEEILAAWSAFGEDAKVLENDETVWDSAEQIMSFIENIATPMECDWRSLDPRRLVDEDEFPQDDEE